MTKSRFHIFLPFFAVLLIASITAVIGYNSFFGEDVVLTQENPEGSTITRHAVFCYSKTHGDTGEVEDIGCTTNNVTYIGLNLTAQWLSPFGQGTSNGNFTFMALCNATLAPAGSRCGSHQNVGAGNGFPNASNSVLHERGEYILNGLSRASTTYATNPGSPGNYSLFHVFTASDVSGLEVNATGLFNQSEISSGWNGTLFAVNKFPHTTLDGTAGDQLTVNITVFVTSG